MSGNKVYNNKDLVKEMNRQLMDLQQIIETMDEKRGKIFIDWLKINNKYLVWEES